MAAEKVTKAAPTAPNADKKRAIETAMAQIEKLYGKGSIMRCGDEQAANVEAISTGSLSLDLALGIGGAALSGYGREADQTVGLFTHLRKDRGPGVFGDVVRHGEGPESSRSFGVHAAFGDHFPVEMGEFFEIPYVLQHGGAAHAGGLDVLVVGNGFPVFGGQSFLVHILLFFVGMQKMPDRFMIEFHIVVIQSKNIAIRIGVASLGICFFCEERTVGVNFSGNRLCFSRIWKISLYLSR